MRRLLYIILLLIFEDVYAQKNPYPVVQFSTNSQTFLNWLPFDTQFLIKGKKNKDIIKIEGYFKLNEKTDPLSKWEKNNFNKDSADYYLLSPELKPNKKYQLHLEFTRQLNKDSLYKVVSISLENVFKNIADTAKDENFEFSFTIKDYKSFIEEIKKILKINFAIGNEEINIEKSGTLAQYNDSDKLMDKIKNTTDSNKNFIDTANKFDSLIVSFNKRKNEISNYQKGSTIILESDTNFIFSKVTLLKNIFSKPIFKNLKYLNSLNCEKKQICAELTNLRNTLTNLTPIFEDSQNSKLLEHVAKGELKLDNSTKRINGDISMFWSNEKDSLKLIIDNHYYNLQLLLKIKQTLSLITKDNDLKEEFEILCKDNKIFDNLENDFNLLFLQINENISFLENYSNLLGKIKIKLSEIAKLTPITLIDEITITGSSDNNFVARANWHISADLGLAYLPNINKVVPYFGTNIYFRPVNKQQSLYKKYNPFKAISLMLGFTITSISEQGVRENLINSPNFNLITGLGMRVNNWIKFSVGNIWYSKLDPNPLINKTKIAGTPFISFSFDADIKTFLNKLFPSKDYTDLINNAPN